MKIPGNLLMTVQNRRGVTAVIVAICLAMLIGFAALAIDVGYLYSTHNELQNVADAAALAGAGYLGSTYETLSYSQQIGYVFNRQDVVDAVNQVAQKNRAAGSKISINDGDIFIGTLDWDYDPPRVNPETLIEPDAVRVIARRDNIANNPIATFFIRVFGVGTASVVADATAALTASTTVEKGELKTPFGVSECIFPKPCTELIQFSPTTESCAGWHNFFDQANANRMDEKMIGLIKGDGDNVSDWDGDGNPDNLCFLDPCGPYWLEHFFNIKPNQESDAAVIDGAEAGTEPINFQGGDIGSLFLGGVLDTDYDGFNVGTVIGDDAHPAPFPALFDYFRFRDGDYEYNEDGTIKDKHDDIWTATIPVYKDDVCCTNPNTSLQIAFFAKIVIHMPNPPPDKTVTVTLDCNDTFTPGRGGGGEGNLKGTIPNLVE